MITSRIHWRIANLFTWYQCLFQVESIGTLPICLLDISVCFKSNPLPHCQFVYLISVSVSSRIHCHIANLFTWYQCLFQVESVSDFRRSRNIWKQSRHKHTMCMCTHEHMHASTQACRQVHTHSHACIHECNHALMHARKHAYKYAHPLTYTCTHIQVQPCTHVCTHIRMKWPHAHAHIRKYARRQAPTHSYLIYNNFKRGIKNKP